MKHQAKNKSSLFPPMLISIYIFVILALLLGIAQAYLIEVDVEKVLEADVTSFHSNSSTNLVSFAMEIYNSGSIAYTARTRIDVFKASDSNLTQPVFTAWSSEKAFMPGDKKTFDLRWYSGEPGDFLARLRVYYANEMMERFFDVKKESSFTHSAQEGLFEIGNFRVYGDFIIFDLDAKMDLEDIFIIPQSFTKGWMFEQKKIDQLKVGEPKTVVLPYESTVFAEDDITFFIVSSEPRIYSEKTFKLIKNSGLTGLAFSIIDSLKLLLNLHQ